jgi:hypothetical protein
LRSRKASPISSFFTGKWRRLTATWKATERRLPAASSATTFGAALASTSCGIAKNAAWMAGSAKRPPVPGKR